MKPYVAIISDSKEEWEEVYRIPEALSPEETIKTTLRLFNTRMGKNLKFVRLKKVRKENG